MPEILSVIFSYWWVLLTLCMVIGYKFVLRVFFGMVIVPEDKIGLITKNFVLFGGNKELPDNRIVATKGEAGMQAQTLAPGLYFGYWIWQYQISMQSFTIIPEGSLGVVYANDGAPLAVGRVLGNPTACERFQDATLFLESGGQKGPQAECLTPGKYRINTLLFQVETASATRVGNDKVGIVTVLDGAPLNSGQIAGKPLDGHSNFQDPAKFLTGGGQKGLQESVIMAGTYYLNPYFVKIEEIPLTEVPIGYVAVVNSFVGEAGEDTSGQDFLHGNIVPKGSKGVWNVPLDPGRYPVNTHTHKIELVPTTNIVLNWAEARTESHKLDENLSTITVRSLDGYPFNLDVSQIIHVPASEAPKVIARFGNMKNLVSQVLEPTIGNYFRNSAQASDVITFLSKRSERQNEAKLHIGGVLREYNVTAVDTLIGDITPPAELRKTLTDRKLAEQQKLTYTQQMTAEATRKEFESAKADADMQQKVMEAERQVKIAEQNANALIQKARGDAESKMVNAKADAEVTRLTGQAESEKILAIGNAEAEVIKNKVQSMGQSAYATVAVADELANGKHPLVPLVQVTGNGGDQAGTLVSSMLALKTLKELDATVDLKKQKSEKPVESQRPVRPSRLEKGHSTTPASEKSTGDEEAPIK